MKPYINIVCNNCGKDLEIAETDVDLKEGGFIINCEPCGCEKMTLPQDPERRKALERISKLEVDLFDGKYGGKGQAIRALEDAVYWACEALDVPKVKLLREEGVGKLMRDKFLTEAMELCWHDLVKVGKYQMACFKCGKAKQFALNPDFSTWQDFGQLWGWAIKQDWFVIFQYYYGYVPKGLINPDKFADALYEYLKEIK